MMKFLSKYIRYSLIAIILASFFTLSVGAQTLTDIDAEIQKTQQEKKARETELNNAKNLLKSLQNQSYSVSSDITSLKNQITDLEKKVEQVTVQVAQLEKSIVDTEKQIELNKNIREKQIKQYFVDSYSDNPLELILTEDIGIERYQTVSAIKSYNIRERKSELDRVSDSYVSLTEDKKQVEVLKKDLETQKVEISKKKTEMQTKLVALGNNISNVSTTTKNIEGQLKGINSNLSYLDATRKKALEQELARIASNPQVQQVPINAGEYFFMGRGRDQIEGHGLGMSQWGMYGMAKNFGWKYDQILTFYYTGVTIGEYDEPTQIVVDGKTNGPIPFDDYLAGIGEVPSSWPEEAVKAQVVAARTYAMRTARMGPDGFYHICGTDACQVYIGGNAKLAQVQATKRKVILYNGAPIVAYYSASHRGCSSTISAVWGSTDLPYIKSVRDDAYAYKDYKSPNPYNPSQSIPTYNWQWRTNGYTLEKLTEIFARSPRTSVGKLKSISVVKDTCGRVSKITLVGESGTKSLTGWDFRTVFNSINPSNDYIYSTEFNFYQK